MNNWSIDNIQAEWNAGWRHKKRWIIVEDADGYSVHVHTIDGVAPPSTYPTKRLAASRLLQLLGIGPVGPQDHPESVCIGRLETDEEPCP